MKMRLSILITLLFTNQICNAQLEGNPNLPEVGKPCPDFTLNDVNHYSKKNVSLEDFKGKWLFLDFWFTGCVNCIKSFPKIDGFQRQFKEKAVFLMVGMNGGKVNRGIKILYENLRKKQNLNLAIAYDSVLIDNWQIYSMPHIVIVDPQGIVRAITGGRDMTAEKIKNLVVDGKDVSFYPKDIDRSDFNPKQFVTISESNPDNFVVYQSVLAKWNGEKQYAPSDITSHLQNGHFGFQASMVPLYALYNYAFLGQWSWSLKDSLYKKVYPLPVLEIRDQSVFQYDYKIEVGKGTFNYRLTTPPSITTPEIVMQILQRELQNIFRFDASIEEREMEVWTLKAAPGIAEKLKTKGGPTSFTGGISSGGVAGFTAKNFSWSKLLPILIRYIGDNEPPFIDETGITGNIDITIDALMTDLNDVQKALKKNGIILARAKRKMSVIVIQE